MVKEPDLPDCPEALPVAALIELHSYCLAEEDELAMVEE